MDRFALCLSLKLNFKSVIYYLGVNLEYSLRSVATNNKKLAQDAVLLRGRPRRKSYVHIDATRGRVDRRHGPGPAFMVLQ